MRDLERTKFRGKKRYYRQLPKLIDETNLDLDDSETWYDAWHIHVDWYGRGNISGRQRREHLKVLFGLFEKLCTQAEQFPQQYQIWVLVSRTDASQDGVFFHTKNPNEDNFPFQFHVDWGASKAPTPFREFMEDPDLEWGVAKDWGNDYIVRSKSHGLPL